MKRIRFCLIVTFCLAAAGAWAGEAGNPRRFRLDVEALAAPQGRAEDATLQLRYRLSDWMDLGVGYRMVEGGADNDKVLTFAWLHYLLASASVDF